MNQAVDRLIRLCPPPAEPEEAVVDWNMVEAKLGARLPADYKEIVRMYGSGSFGGFLSLYWPETDNQYMDLAANCVRTLDALRSLQDLERIPYRIERGSEEILSWGGTDNGDEGFWVKNGDDPDLWTVTVNEKSPRWYPYDGSLAEFICAALNADLEEGHPFGGDVWGPDRLVFYRASDPDPDVESY